MDFNEINDTTSINEIAMQIIIFAGDARFQILEAIKEVEDFNFSDAQVKFFQAEEKIKSAHVLHTKVIQNEARGEVKAPSLLFTHAQDTLMTIKSELLMMQQLMNVIKRLDDRFKKLEKNE